MEKRLFVLFLGCFALMGQVFADNVLRLNDVDIQQGGEATIEISCNFDKDYTAFSFELSLPEGLSLVFEETDKGFDSTDHELTKSLHSNGNYLFTCLSNTNATIPKDGVLVSIKVMADNDAPIGNYEGSILESVFTGIVNHEAYSDNLDTDFTINVLEKRTILDENATTLPDAEEGVNVLMKRTLTANVWSTIVLPFAMNESQVKDAFGEDVQLADFTGYTTDENINDEIISIAVHFQSVNNIEENHPYLIKVSENINEFSVDGVDINPEEEPTNAVIKRTKKQWSEMIGTYTAGTIIPAHTLFISGNKFWYSTGETKMKGFRAYFDFYDELADVEDAFSKVAFYVDNVKTNIESNHKAESLNDNVYDLQGRKMTLRSNTSLPKGIYIVNGKKYTVK